MTIDPEVFWQWCLARYQNPSLRSALLKAQDYHDAVVMELLLAGWLAERGIPYTARDHHSVAMRIAPWYREVILALRERRREWQQDSARVTLSEPLLDLEVRAERVLADLMLSTIQPEGGGEPHQLLPANLSVVFTASGSVDQPVAALIDELATHMASPA